MGPEEEFKFHNEQNSWPMLFEVIQNRGWLETMEGRSKTSESPVSWLLQSYWNSTDINANYWP